MKLRVSDIAGLHRAPGTVQGLRYWLKSRDIPVERDGNRRNPRGADDWSAFDWLRAMSEEAFAFPIAFVGDLSLLELADKRGGLWRRAGEGRRLVLRGIERGDVEGLAADFGLSDAASVEALYQVARREGGLGYVATISRHACKLAGRDRVEGAHVLAAIEYLNLNRLGPNHEPVPDQRHALGRRRGPV